jgi:hypothetical protein
LVINILITLLKVGTFLDHYSNVARTNSLQGRDGVGSADGKH